MSVKPVNGQCPEGYVYVAGGEDGKSGGSCMKNPFTIKFDKEGNYIYDKQATSFAGKYAKAILNKMPEELRNEKSYNDIIGSIIGVDTLSQGGPLHKIIKLINSGNTDGLNKIISDINSGNNTEYIDYSKSLINKGIARFNPSNFPAVTEIQYPYPRSSEKSKKEIDAENFYQTNPKEPGEYNPENYGTAIKSSGAITRESKWLLPSQEPTGFESVLFDYPGIRTDSEKEDIVNFSQQRLAEYEKSAEDIRRQIDSGIGSDGKKLSNKSLDLLKSKLNGINENIIDLKNNIKSAGGTMPLGVSQSFGVNQFPQSQQQTTPPPQPVIPPTTPQGQVEFMQQQAQQMPVPNEVSSRTQFPQMTGGIPEAEQQVGMQEEVPQDNGSIFQRLRNLFSGKSPQPPQPNVAPQVTPQTTPQQPIDNRVMGGGARGGSAMNEMMPKEFQNAQNLGQQVTQPGMFGGGVGDGSSMGQSATTGLSGAFATAGESPVGTTGTVAGATNVNTGALPQSVVDNATQTQTTIPTETTGGQPTGQVAGQGTQAGTDTKPPPLATPGIVGGGNTFSPQFIAGGGGIGGGLDVRVLPGQVVTTTDEKGQKSKSIQDLIEIGGTGFDDEVLARKLRRQAAMPELKNEDYYPNQPFTQAQTAWGDPIFSGAGALFPMAAYDAQRKARAQAEIDEAKRNVMQIKIPEIKTGAYVQRFRDGYTQEVMALVDEATKATGGNRKKAYQYLTQTGKLDALQNRYEGVARSIDQTADRAKEFLKNAQEKSTTMYFSPEGVRAATNFMNGMDAFSKGEITPDMLNQLEQQFRSAESWQTYKDRNIGKLKPTDYIPTPEQLKNITEEDRKSFEAVQLDLGNKAPDFNTWLFTQKYSEAALPQVMKSIVQPFFDENKTAAEQLVLPGEKLEDAKLRIANSISALFGRQYSQGTVTQNQRGKGTTIVLGSGGGKEKQGFWESTVLGNNEITTSLKNNINNPNINITDAIEQSFGGSWRVRPNDPYVRVSVPGQQYKGTVTPERYDDYVMPTPASGTGAASGQYAPIGKDKNGKDILMQFGVTDRGQTPKAAKIVGAEMGYAVRDPKTKQWNLITQENLKKNGLPPGAKQVVIESQLLYNAPLEETEGTSITMESGANVQGGGSARRGETKGLKAYRIYEATLENTRHLDNATNPTTSNEGAINPGGTGGFSGSVTVEDASL